MGKDREEEKEKENERPGVKLRPHSRLLPKKPALYKVIILDDDTVPMEFVVQIIESFFGKNHDEAVTLTLEIHSKGAGVCGVFTHEVAETKAEQVMAFAERHQYPLKCSIEKE